MQEYKKMYFILFNEMSKTIERLQESQRIAEELYMNSIDGNKNIDDIVRNIGPTADIQKVIKPVYKFKAVEED